jgi:hypothetical protein
VQVGKRGEFLAILLVEERIGENGVLRQFSEADVAAHVFQIGAIILAHEEDSHDRNSFVTAESGVSTSLFAFF